MEPITILLGAMCCLGGMFVLVALVGLLLWRSQRSSKPSTPPAGSGPPTPRSEPAASQGGLPAAASADLSVGAPSGLGLAGGAPLDEVEDFDEDGPTTLMDTRSPELRGLLGTPVLPAVDEDLVHTERIRMPKPPTRGEPFDPAAVPGVDGPPPLPDSHSSSAPPSSRHMLLDPPKAPDTSALQPGATIIPPDDWNEDYIDDDEVDETMLMARPPLPPKD